MGNRLFTCLGYLSLVQPKPQMSQRSSGTDVPWAQHVLSSLCQWGRRLRCGLPVGTSEARACPVLFSLREQEPPLCGLSQYPHRGLWPPSTLATTEF